MLLAVPKLRRLVAGLSLQRPVFARRPVHVGFVVDKVAMRQVFLRVFRFSPVNIILPLLHTHSCAIWGADNGSLNGRSSTEISLPLVTITTDTDNNGSALIVSYSLET
jgi:hypothetical protein